MNAFIHKIRSEDFLGSKTELNDTISSVQKICMIIRELASNSIFPYLNKIRLIDVLEEDEEKLIDFIKDNSILSNIKDIEKILETKYLFSKGEPQEILETKLLDIYYILFESKLKLNKKVTLFSGGTGSNPLTKGLLKAGAEITLLLNAYDDGKSTGDIRRKFNFLGPSDITKNLLALMGDSDSDLKKFLNYRLSRVKTLEELRDYLRNTAVGREHSNPVNDLLEKIEPQIRENLRVFLRRFDQLVSDWEIKNSRRYNLRDYGVRNIIYIGAHLFYGGDYHHTNNKLIELFKLKGKIVLNNQRPLWLIAITEKGNLLNSESEIVNDHLDQEIAEIFLVERMLKSEEIERLYSLKSKKERQEYIKKNFAIYPLATEESKEAITESELIIFSPTTLHSSLTPTLITRDIPQSLNQSKALKISIANLLRERGYHTVGESLGEMEKYINHQVEGPMTNIDYIIINTHGHKTLGVINTSRLPVDKNYISQQGVELIEINIGEDNKQHKNELITQVIRSLKAIDDIGYGISNGRLIKKQEINLVENKKEQLIQLLRNPFLYKVKAPKIERLIKEILKISRIEDFEPLRPVKVVILGAGRGTRLNSNIPKILYPINGKPNLAHLLDRYYKIDENPLVVVSEEDKPKIEAWLEFNPQYKANLIAAKDIRGTAMTLHEVMNRGLKDFDGDIFLSWGDITNTSLETIRLTSALHHAVDDSIMTLPTSWEKNPYAGITRDDDGRVNGTFITKEYPEQKKEFGEHDSSIFIFKCREIMEAFNKIVYNSGIEEGKVSELNFLKVIPLLASEGKEILGIACVDPRECIGFNTQEEARLVEQYMKELKEGIPFKELSMEQDIENNFLESSDYNNEIFKEHLDRLGEYLKRVYKGILVDLDETITDDDGNIPDDVVETLGGFANEGVPVGIVTGRSNNSLMKKIILKITSHPSIKDFAKSKIYIYPENGAYCYRLDQGVHRKLYENKISYYISETAIKLIRKNILGFKDDYSVTEYKIHIWPENPSNQKNYVQRLNYLFKKMNLPLVAYRSSPIETSGSILISKTKVNKENALSHFAKTHSLSIHEIVKIGDMADQSSVDKHLLKGIGSFSVSEFDINDKSHVGIPLSKGPKYKGVNGSRWLFENLRFST